jgi:5-methylcytosine-specific restriction endonuclease McrA
MPKPMTLKAQVEFWRHRAEIAEEKLLHFRDPKWPVTRAAHLKKEDSCQACGIKTHLEVHHCIPVSVDKTLERVDSNLLTLCESPGKNCHFEVGHFRRWSTFNPNVRADAAALLKKGG